ncbi:hypothetical protein FOXYSP1_17805 [Fusarium oxysporum f. sp. phaseoli]
MYRQLATGRTNCSLRRGRIGSSMQSTGWR